MNDDAAKLLTCLPPADAMFASLMALNQEAFAAGLYNVAYHVLAAAVHCAADRADGGALAQVARVAEDQLEWIDAHAPMYEHTTTNANTRGMTHSIFQTLAHQAAVHQRIIEQDACKGAQASQTVSP